MRTRGWFLVGVVCVLLLCMVAGEAGAKSVFAVAGHDTGIVKAYLVGPDSSITFQADIPNPLPDATGLCLWPQKDRMFVTYEGKGTISWARIKTLARDPEKDNYETAITGGNGLGGMAVDEAALRLYVISRGTNRLYAFNYNEQSNTLLPIQLGSGTVYRVLPEVAIGMDVGGMDIAIDKQGSLVFGIPVGRIYASDNTTSVRYYNMETWQYEGAVAFERGAIGIGLDTVRGYLYAGNFGGGGGHWYLMRMSLSGEANTYVEKDMGCSVMDIAVDEETGLIYLTSNRNYNGRGGAIEVYDPTGWNSSDPNSLVLIDIENDADFGGTNNGPGGIGIGPSYKVPRMWIDKVDDVNEITESVLPDDIYHYYISYHAGPLDEQNVVITDCLPMGLDFISAEPSTGTYYPPPEHRYVWVIGDVPAYDPNAPGDQNYYFMLTVQVSNKAEPAGELVNIVEAESDEGIATDKETTPVGFWGGNIIYVDSMAGGANIGTGWADAYIDLQRAIARAVKGCGNEIWVAKGTYFPGTQTTDSFVIPAGVNIYGGFGGYETQRDQRNWRRYKTVLTGYIGKNIYGIDAWNNTVVTMENNSLLDGVTITEAGNLFGTSQGIYGQNIDFAVENCVIENNQRYGVHALNSNATIKWCEIWENGFDGIYHEGSNYTLNVENCTIYDNQQNGIYCYYSVPTIINSIIHHNGLSGGTGYYGIRLDYPSGQSVLRNNTIVANKNEGIKLEGGSVPDVRNDILYYNNDAEQHRPQLSGIGTTHYCCIYDPNSQSSTPDANGNIKCEPDFVYDEEPYGFYHIKYESHCRNGGDNTYIGQDETDMDNEVRIQEGTVDIGADEVSCEDTWNENDWTFDGVINTEEFSVFSAAWRSHDPNDPVCNPNNPGYVSDPNAPGYISASAKANWNPTCNLDTNGAGVYAIDLYDFTAFCENWLWQACWHENYIVVMYGMSGGGENMMMASPAIMTEQLYSAQSLKAESIQPIYEPDPVSLEKATLEILYYLDNWIAEGHENIDGLLEVKAILEEWLDETRVPKKQKLDF